MRFGKWNGLFCSGDFAVWEAPASLQRCIEVILHIELKQGYCEIWSPDLPQYFEKYLEIFIRHLAAAMPLLETDNISPVCRYIIEMWVMWPVLMARTWKNRFLLAAFWDNLKISIFHLDQTEHRLARGDCPLCEPHHALISYIWLPKFEDVAFSRFLALDH